MADWSQHKLIYDLGVHQGRDTEQYLRKGFRVVGVEASPILAAEVRERLGSFISSGQFTLLNIGIWHEVGEIPFYRNLDKDDWSSFDAAYGCRNGTAFEVLKVPTITLGDLVREHGVPYYMKVDIEGADKHVVKAMGALPHLPDYTSAEEYGVQIIDDLLAAGYKRFHLAPQNHKVPPAEPQQSLEGITVPCKFGGHHSGVFGRDIADWQEPATFREHFKRALADRVNEWYDVHATA